MACAANPALGTVKSAITRLRPASAVVLLQGLTQPHHQAQCCVQLAAQPQRIVADRMRRIGDLRQQLVGLRIQHADAVQAARCDARHCRRRTDHAHVVLCRQLARDRQNRMQVPAVRRCDQIDAHVCPRRPACSTSLANAWQAARTVLSRR